MNTSSKATPDAIAAALPDALDIVDTPTNREHLARAVLALHELIIASQTPA